MEAESLEDSKVSAIGGIEQALERARGLSHAPKRRRLPSWAQSAAPIKRVGFWSRWLAARASESEGTLSVLEHHLGLQQRAHRLVVRAALAPQLVRSLLNLLDAAPHLAGGGHSEAAELRGNLTILLGGTQELGHVDVTALAALVEGHGGPAQRTLRRPAGEGRRRREAEQQSRERRHESPEDGEEVFVQPLRPDQDTMAFAAPAASMHFTPPRSCRAGDARRARRGHAYALARIHDYAVRVRPLPLCEY